MIPHAILSMMCSLSLYKKAKKNLSALSQERYKISSFSRAFLVCLFVGGGVGWDLTENQRVKQINSYPLLSNYLQNCQPEGKPSRIPFFHFLHENIYIFLFVKLLHCRKLSHKW